ncbi:MAG: SPOR domain-containing protein [Halioglobus sp.]|nr:SPOR domain-containing protein [Halioglobus sp.]
MNDILKQRLVGALILLALGVVFWPIVFVEPEEKTTTMQPRGIPEPPAVSTAGIEAPGQGDLRGSPELTDSDYAQGVDNPLPDGDVLADGNEEVVDAIASNTAEVIPENTPAASEVRSEAPKPLAVDSDGVPVAWTLQVATVSSAEKAEALRLRLLQKSEKAYVTKVSSGGKQLYRVCVGPKFEKQELERMQASINAEFGVKTMLVRYLP